MSVEVSSPLGITLAVVKETFLAAVREWLAARGSVEELHELVLRHKDGGLTQAEAYAALTQLLATAPDDEIDDRIRDVLDFVVGWCSPHMRIWPDYYMP